MSMRAYGILAGAAALMAWALPLPAQALTIQECSAKYEAAKSAGTLNGMSWNEFRKAECRGDAAPAPSPTTTTAAPSGTGLTMHECSQRYEAAKSAGTLGGLSWNEFRKAECSAGAAAAAPSPAPTTAAPSGTGLTMHECGQRYEAAKSAGTLGGMSWNEFRKAECSAGAAAAVPTPNRATAPSSVSVGNAVFPRAISPRFAGQSAGEARMHTCLEQYYANKANNQNGGLEWTEKGGGYYSECDKILKSARQ